MQQFEMTKCNQCGSEILMGLDVCPNCGKRARGWQGGSQPRTMLAVGLTATALFVCSYLKPAPHAHPVTSPPSASLPSR